MHGGKVPPSLGGTLHPACNTNGAPFIWWWHASRLLRRLTHAQLRTVEYDTPAGETVVVPASAVRNKRCATPPLRPVPALGEHTESFLAEFRDKQQHKKAP